MNLGKKDHSQKPRDKCLIICHKEVPPAVLAKSRTRTPDHLLVSDPHLIKQPVRPLSFHLQTEINQMINDMQKQGLTEESSSSWCSPVVLKQRMSLGDFAKISEN